MFYYKTNLEIQPPLFFFGNINSVDHGKNRVLKHFQKPEDI